MRGLALTAWFLYQFLAADLFTQADGALSASWAADFGFTAPTVVSNTARDTASLGAQSAALYTGATFPNDQWAQFNIITSTGTNDFQGVILRGRTATSLNEYRAYVVGPLGATAVLHIVKEVAGSFTDLGNTGSITVNSGDALKFTAQGTTLTAYINDTQMLQRTDSAVTAGQPGIIIGNDGTAANSVLDNFYAGAIQ